MENFPSNVQDVKEPEVGVENQRLVNPDLQKEYDGPDSIGVYILGSTLIQGFQYYCLYVYSISPERIFVTDLDVLLLDAERQLGVLNESFFTFGLHIVFIGLYVDNSVYNRTQSIVSHALEQDLLKKMHIHPRMKMTYDTCRHCTHDSDTYTSFLSDKTLNIVVTSSDFTDKQVLDQNRWVCSFSQLTRLLPHISDIYSNMIESVYTHPLEDRSVTEPVTLQFISQNLRNEYTPWCLNITNTVHNAIASLYTYTGASVVFVTQLIPESVLSRITTDVSILSTLPVVKTQRDQRVYSIRLIETMDQDIQMAPMLTNTPSGCIIMYKKDVASAVELALEQYRAYLGFPVIPASSAYIVHTYTTVIAPWELEILHNAMERGYMERTFQKLQTLQQVILQNSQIGFSSLQSVMLEEIYQGYMGKNTILWKDHIVQVNTLLANITSKTHTPLDRLIATLSPLLAPLIVPIFTAIGKAVRSWLSKRKKLKV